jgi:hypothetical protein
LAVRSGILLFNIPFQRGKELLKKHPIGGTFVATVTEQKLLPTCQGLTQSEPRAVMVCVVGLRERAFIAGIILGVGLRVRCIMPWHKFKGAEFHLTLSVAAALT